MSNKHDAHQIHTKYIKKKKKQRISYDRHTLKHYIHTHIHVHIYIWNRVSCWTLSTVLDKPTNYFSYPVTIMSQTGTSWSLSLPWCQIFLEKPAVYGQEIPHTIWTWLATLLTQAHQLFWAGWIQSTSLFLKLHLTCILALKFVCMYYFTHKKTKFTLEQVIKAQRGSRGKVPLSLWPRR